MPVTEQYMFSTSRANKYEVDDVVPFKNGKYRITRIKYNQKEGVYDIYGVPVF